MVATLYLASERALRGDREGFKDFKRAYDTAMKLAATNVPSLAEHLAKDVEKSARQFGIDIEIKPRRPNQVQKGPLL